MIKDELQDLLIKMLNGKILWWEKLRLKTFVWFDDDAEELMNQYQEAGLLIARQVNGHLSPEGMLELSHLVETLPGVGQLLELRNMQWKSEKQKVFILLETCPELNAEPGSLQDLMIKKIGDSGSADDYDAVIEYKSRSKGEARLITRYNAAEIRIAELMCEKIAIDDLIKLQADIIELPGVADILKKSIPKFEDPKIKKWLNERPPFDCSLARRKKYWVSLPRFFKLLTSTMSKR